MKRLLILTTILVLVFSVSVGAQTLNVLVRPDEGDVVETYTSQFEEKTGIKVDVTFVGWNQLTTKTTTAVMDQGGGYDVIFVSSADKLRLAAMDQFIDLNQYLTEKEKSQHLETVVDFYTYKGKMIGVPWYSGAAHFVYNAKYLEDANVDVEDVKTWEGLLDASKAITEESAAEYAYTPSAKYPGNYYFNYGSMVFAMGGRLLDEDNNPVFNEGKALRALEIMVEGVENKVFNPSGTSLDDYETLKVFQSGKSAFLLNSTWSANQAMLPEASNVADDAEIMLNPGSESNETGGLLYAGAFAVTKSSQHKEEAVELVKLLTGSEAQIKHAVDGNNLPTRLELFEETAIEEVSKSWAPYEKLVAQVEAGTFGPDVLWLDPFRRTLSTAVQDALSGEKTAKEALDWAAEEVESLKAQYE